MEESQSYGAQTDALGFPYGMTLSADGGLLITDYPNRLVKRSPNGAVVTVYNVRGGSATKLPAFNDVALGPDGSMFLADGYAGYIVKLDSTGAQIAAFNTSNPAMRGAGGVAVNTAGQLLVADTGNSRMVKLSATGEQLWAYGLDGAVPSDVVVDASDAANNAFVSAAYCTPSVRFDGCVMKLNSTGAVVAVYHTSQPSYPTALAWANTAAYFCSTS